MPEIKDKNLEDITSAIKECCNGKFRYRNNFEGKDYCLVSFACPRVIKTCKYCDPNKILVPISEESFFPYNLCISKNKK